MFFYTLFYLLFSFLLVYPPIEFISAGLTIPSVFSKFLGSENETFIKYHIVRIIITYFVHSCIPLGYIVGLFLNEPDEVIALFYDEGTGFWWKIFLTVSLIIPIVTSLKIIDWSRASLDSHPLCRKLTQFCDPTSDWMSVASNINVEFRRIDKISIQTNPTSKIVVTDNWIIKIGLYELNFAHQSDAMLLVNNAHTFNLTPIVGGGEMQFINIEVKSVRNYIPAFNIRLNARDFRDLQDKVIRPIIVLPNIVFHKTVVDKFIEVFKNQIDLNEKYSTSQELDLCIGCMQAVSNVKLNKLCSDSTEAQGAQPPTPCTHCNCRPMWCGDCMARWFASRQDPDVTDKWLSSKCTCPVCRATFCLLDVSYIVSTN